MLGCVAALSVSSYVKRGGAPQGVAEEPGSVRAAHTSFSLGWALEMEGLRTLSERRSWVTCRGGSSVFSGSPVRGHGLTMSTSGSLYRPVWKNLSITQLALYVPSKKILTFKTPGLIQVGKTEARAQPAIGRAGVNPMPSSGSPNHRLFLPVP